MTPPRRGSLTARLPQQLPTEEFTTLVHARGARIKRIVSLGHVTEPGRWYDQDWNEWVVVIAGAARLRFEGEDAPIAVRADDWIDIPAHRRHRFEWTDPIVRTAWLAVHYA
jgi:cupin 2 domain-containing protein